MTAASSAWVPLDPMRGLLGSGRPGVGLPPRRPQEPAQRPPVPADVPKTVPPPARPLRGLPRAALLDLHGTPLEPDTERGRIVRALDALGPGRWTPADIAVRAWSTWPEAFALPGHPRHADACAVRARLAGERGLVARGWIAHTETGYALTNRGRAWCAAVRRECE